MKFTRKQFFLTVVGLFGAPAIPTPLKSKLPPTVDINTLLGAYIDQAARSFNVPPNLNPICGLGDYVAVRFAIPQQPTQPGTIKGKYIDDWVTQPYNGTDHRPR